MFSFNFFLLHNPDKTTNANSINLIIKSKKPGFKKVFENVSNEYKLKDLFFGSNIEVNHTLLMIMRL